MTNTTESSQVQQEIETETDLKYEIYGLCVVSVALITIMIMIGVRLIPKLHFLSESIISLFIGIILGLILMVAHFIGFEHRLTAQSFASIFKTVFLPLIIFNAGFTMKKRNFFKNIVPILSFAIGGCLLSSIIIGFGIYGYTKITTPIITLGTENNLSLSQSLQFGTLLGATDPVATLALFLELNVDPLLYSLVFGESVLNDAVSIVLFHTLDGASSQFTYMDILSIVGQFFLISIGSIVVGLVISYFSAFIVNITKHAHISATFNLVIFICIAFFGYFVAELLGLSGILTIFVCGAIMSHHHWYSVPENQRVVLYTSVGTLAFVSETLTFISVGITLFDPNNLKADYWNPLFIPYVLVLCFVSRAFNVFPISFLMNLRKKAKKITWRHQIMLWYAGLRGAIAIILALQMDNPHVINTTYSIVLFTNVIIGMTTPPLLKLMKIEMGGDEPLNVRDINKNYHNVDLNDPNANNSKKAFRKMFVMFDELILKKYFGGQPRKDKDLRKIDILLVDGELETDREALDRKFRDQHFVEKEHEQQIMDDEEKKLLDNVENLKKYESKRLSSIGNGALIDKDTLLQTRDSDDSNREEISTSISNDNDKNNK